MSTKDVASPPPPTTMAGRFVRYVVGFGVSVGLGLAPFLGALKVPGFSALLELFPLQIRGVLIPLSAFLMGLVAVAIQFYHKDGIQDEALNKYFRRGFVTIVLSFFFFIISYRLFVLRVPIEAGRKGYGMVVVTPTRLDTCDCRGLTNVQCVQKLTFDPGELETCWGGPALELRELSLEISYLLLTSGFGALIGLLLLKERNLQQHRPEASQQRRKGTPTVLPPELPPTPKEGLDAPLKTKPRRRRKPRT